MNITITKDITKANCITHAGTFHADEVFASVILSKIKKDITLIRLPEVRGQVENDVIVYDIGGGRYDHHQFGGNGQRENGVKYASCGLIWKEFGKEMLKKYKVGDIDYTWQYIDKSLIQFIDADDNGQLPRTDISYKYVHISKIIGLFNPKWNEDIESDTKFLKALSIAEIIFDEFMKDTISKIEAKGLVEKSINQSKEGIMILEKYLPWKEFLLESEEKKAKDIKFVVFPSKRGGYNVYAVPKQLGSFENRKNLPEAWRGLRDEKLQRVTGVKTARFCHNGGFICSADEFQDALILAQIANRE